MSEVRTIPRPTREPGAAFCLLPGPDGYNQRSGHRLGLPGLRGRQQSLRVLPELPPATAVSVTVHLRCKPLSKKTQHAMAEMIGKAIQQQSRRMFKNGNYILNFLKEVKA